VEALCSGQPSWAICAFVCCIHCRRSLEITEPMNRFTNDPLLFFCVPGTSSTQYGHLGKNFIGSPTTQTFLSSSHHDTSHMPTRKGIPSDDDEDRSDSEPMPPPSKKAKTSSNKNDQGATSTSDTRLRTISSKQAALSDFLFSF